jgi:hypothetical protein
MELIQTIDWVINNKEVIIVRIGGAVVVARAIVQLTPTDKDNKWFEKWFKPSLEFVANVGLPNLVKVRGKIQIEKKKK